MESPPAINPSPIGQSPAWEPLVGWGEMDPMAGWATPKRSAEPQHSSSLLSEGSLCPISLAPPPMLIYPISGLF